MDTDRFVEFLSTVVIVGLIAALAAPSFGATGLQGRVLAAAGIAAVVGVPLSALLVYVLDASSSHFGPWGPEDVVFVAAVGPPIAATVWIVERAGLAGALYGIGVLVGVVVSIAIAVVVRDATVGEWPPGSSTRRRRGTRGPDGK